MTDLVLGTAQFGAGYGVMNNAGRMQDQGVRGVCATAVAGGIEVFDSSPYYGDAQQRMGALLSSDRRPRFVSKFGLSDHHVPALDELITRTLNELRVDRLAGLLFHRVDDLRDSRALDAAALLRNARARGLVDQVGASVYSLADLEAALEILPDMDIVQLPGNVLDRRLLDHPLLAEFHSRGGSVHVRSAYLQGILLASPERIPARLARLRPVVTELRAIAQERGATVIEFLLGFLKHHPVVDAVVVGALTVDEMRGTLAAWDRAPEAEWAAPELDERLLDPRKWGE